MATFAGQAPRAWGPQIPGVLTRLTQLPHQLLIQGVRRSGCNNALLPAFSKQVGYLPN